MQILLSMHIKFALNLTHLHSRNNKDILVFENIVKTFVKIHYLFVCMNQLVSSNILYPNVIETSYQRSPCDWMHRVLGMTGNNQRCE